MFKEANTCAKKYRRFYVNGGMEQKKEQQKKGYASQPQLRSHYECWDYSPSLNFINSQQENPFTKFESDFESPLSNWSKEMDELKMENEKIMEKKKKD